MNIFAKQFPSSIFPFQNIKESFVQIQADLDYPISGIINNLNNRNTKHKQHTSINTSQIHQQTEIAHILQPTIRILQSATDKVINKSKKIILQRLPENNTSKMRHEDSTKKKRKRKETNKSIINAPNTKSKKEKNKNNGSANTKAKPSEGAIKKCKTKRPKEGKMDHMEYLMKRRELGDTNALVVADKTARSNADKKMDIYSHKLNPADWKTAYQQKY
ncbi:uncharacterized protein EAF02_003475 [Botrytis sinoallii]|uniref:uncharacterized protein n=1 Tax=Botrytis sinoallii TaxID=1463999 RepID=UPI00190124F9|nr:uncharacterized protein EAF02_003475 [Botrytis sinoallii]KAF7886828.1 hypothetical protein EAF02_003475 [Botrytis sinoallii]